MIKNATKALSLAIIIIIGFIAIKFEHHTEDICQSLDKIYQTSTIGVQSINESKLSLKRLALLELKLYQNTMQAMTNRQ